ncbi:MAG: SDR family oxidoreductase [Comamonadaceae bacterium]|nr:MAG: SDR family oxidoreductase [Comamonadaceae bacterium]
MAGKTALVTGSTGGLGQAIAEALAHEGCNIVLHGIQDPDAMQPVQAGIAERTGVRVDYQRCDLSDPSAIEAMMGRITSSHGRVDVLVNNAVTRHFSPIDAFPVEAWDRSLAVNLSAAFHTIRLALPGMREAGWGRIFNMTSVYGSRATANRIDYVTTKTALIGMTRAVAIETINQGITCNAVCPGSVFTPAIDQRVQALMQEQALDLEQATRLFLEGKQPIQRFVEASHVGDLIIFLCGRAGRDITGALLPLEGGWLAS